MVDLNSQLTIKHSDSGVFSDYSFKSNSFERDTYTLSHESATDYLYVGYKKPISSIYINHKTTYVTDGTLTAEYYNGSIWVSLNGFSDDTISFKRSGFIRWPLSQISQAQNSVDGLNLYWYRFKSSVDRALFVIAGINIVFADDYDLSLEQPLINSEEFRGTQTSHILIHVAARNEILQKFKNDDYIKQDSSGNYVDINAWDLHDILEVHQAAVFLAISKLYSNMSDSKDDVWSQKATVYLSKYEKMINVARLSLDLNDDGVEQSSEQKQESGVRYMVR